jgi:hypothetical protein
MDECKPLHHACLATLSSPPARAPHTNDDGGVEGRGLHLVTVNSS